MVRTLGKLTGAVLSAALLASASCSLVLGLEEAKVKPTTSDAGGGGGTAVQCTIDGDCPLIVPQCQKYICNNNVCELGSEPDDTTCSLNGGTFCLDGVCSRESCTDKRLNGNESDIDCGGNCSPCQLTQLCNSPKDCASMSCNQICISSCEDGQTDGTETDIDCGGGNCPQCFTGGKCFKPEDCVSKLCTANICK